MVDPRTDRDRLVGHAYKTSAPFLPGRVSTATNEADRHPALGPRPGEVGARRAHARRRVRSGSLSRDACARSNASSGALGMDLSAGMAAEASRLRTDAGRRRAGDPVSPTCSTSCSPRTCSTTSPNRRAALREDRARVASRRDAARRPQRPRALARDAHARSTGARRRRARSTAEPAARSSERLSIETAEPVLTRCFSVLAFEHLQRVLDVPDSGARRRVRRQHALVLRGVSARGLRLAGVAGARTSARRCHDRRRGRVDDRHQRRRLFRVPARRGVSGARSTRGWAPDVEAGHDRRGSLARSSARRSMSIASRSGSWSSSSTPVAPRIPPCSARVSVLRSLSTDDTTARSSPSSASRARARRRASRPVRRRDPSRAARRAGRGRCGPRA